MSKQDNKIINLNDYIQSYEDIYGIENDELAVLVQHNPRSNKLKLKFITKDNQQKTIVLEPLQSVGLMMALEEALDSNGTSPRKNKK